MRFGAHTGQRVVQKFEGLRIVIDDQNLGFEWHLGSPLVQCYLEIRASVQANLKQALPEGITADLLRIEQVFLTGASDLLSGFEENREEQIE